LHKHISANILSLEHVTDDNDKSITIDLGEGFNLLDYFVMHIFEKYNFPTLFYGHLRPSLARSSQKIMQVEITSLNFSKCISYE
jgi:hypothetical protein